MAVTRRFDTITVTASQDLTGHQYKAVGLDGLVAETTLAAVGILQNKADVNDHATLAYAGHMKCIVGAAVNSNSQIGITTSGFAISVATSDYIGFTLSQAGSGDVVDFVGNFANRAD